MQHSSSAVSMIRRSSRRIRNRLLRSQLPMLISAFALLFTAAVGINGASKPVNSSSGNEEVLLPKDNSATKLSIPPSTTADYGGGGMDECSKDSILVFQGATSPLPNGIPTYTVEVENACLSESCSISGIHLSCGWFSSARLIDPAVFRRIDYDDCLVNDGAPLNPGESVSFQYANTFQYPLSVSSVSC